MDQFPTPPILLFWVVQLVPGSLPVRTAWMPRARICESGGVSAVIFAFIYYHPWSKLGMVFIPGLGLPAIVFAILYLVYSAYSARKGSGNIGHDAHFWGGVYGFAFAFFSDPTHGRIFIEQLKGFQ